jgi:hypothetical protein
MRKILMSALLLAGVAGTVQAQTSVTCSANFTLTQTSSSPIQVTVNNTSTYSATGQYVYAFGYINYGDGSTNAWTTPGASTTHAYSNAGSYTVWLVHSVLDSMTQQLLCIDSLSQSITVTGNPAGGNSISGDIHWDPTAVADSFLNFKVWLIEHDTTANTLTAIDSVNVWPWINEYTFNNKPGGDYLVKAAANYAFGPIPVYGLVPTYHDSSLYWSGAATINHTGGVTTGKDIWMRYGTPTTGPGFVGGNISAGAGKGTGTGVEGILVYLRNNANNKLVGSTYTDANGDYSFSDIATGSYNVYPEAMNYATTPSAVLSLTNGQASSNDVDFVQTEDEIKPASVLGISELGKNDGIKIYPNPVNDRLFIENKNGTFNQVTVINTLGQVVKKDNIKKGNNVIDIAVLNSGIYYLIVNGTDGARSMKITKK